MTKFFIFVITFGLGIAIGRLTVSSPTSFKESESELELKLSDLEKNSRSRIESISELNQKILEIQKLREEVFKIFLADIALKIDQKFWNQAIETAATTPTPTPVVSAPVVKVEEPTVSTPELTVEQKVDQKIEDAPNDRIGDLTQYFNSAVLVKNGNHRLMKYIQGNFRGEARILDGKRKLWKIFIGSNLQYMDQNWSGSVNIELSDEEGIFSNSSGNGSNNNFYQSGSDKNALIVRASPNVYLNLKWQERRQIFTGNIYKRKDEESKWKMIGKIPQLIKE